MKHLLVFIAFSCLELSVQAQNVGINTASPTSSLDINGGLRLRTETSAVSGTSVVLPGNRSNHIITGAPTGNFTITLTGTLQEGQHIIITNTNIVNGTLSGQVIPAGNTTELLYVNGGWKKIGSSEVATSTAWGLAGNNATFNNFIGTVNDAPLLFKVFNAEAGGMGLWGNVALGGARSNNFFTQVSSGSIQNTAIGNAALQNNSVMYANTAIGFSASQNNINGNSNTSVGHYALNKNKNGTYAVAIGKDALLNDTAAEQTVAVGGNALYWNNNRFGNTAVGTNSLFYNSNPDMGLLSAKQGLHNTALGHSALFSNRSGSGAVAIGYQAAYTDANADGIVAIGRGALYNNIGGNSNVAIGDSALFLNGLGTVSGFPAFGNTAVGTKTLLKNTTGYSNTAVGVFALISNVSGFANTAIGTRSALRNTSGYNNTSIGIGSLGNNQISSGNVAIGYVSMNNLNPTEVVGDNVAVGNLALYGLTEGYENVAIGANSMGDKTLGNRNTSIGNEAGRGNTVGSGNVFIGNQAGAVSKANNKLYIENTNADSLNALIYGDFWADSLLLNAKTVVRNNAVVRGFTKLGGYGAEVPAIKMKKIIIPAGPAVDGLASYPFGSGITDSKVLGVDVLMKYDNAGTSKIPPSYRDAAGYEYNIQIQFNGVTIINKPGNSANIGAKQITILVTYEE